MKAHVIMEAQDASPIRGKVIRVDEPLSFWGGVDPATGTLADPRSALRGTSIAGSILLVAEPRGSSSSSAVMLELLARRLAPAALVLGKVDAILGLGIIVAGEMGYATIPLLQLEPAWQRQLPQGQLIVVHADGSIACLL